MICTHKFSSGTGAGSKLRGGKWTRSLYVLSAQGHCRQVRVLNVAYTAFTSQLRIVATLYNRPALPLPLFLWGSSTWLLCRMSLHPNGIAAMCVGIHALGVSFMIVELLVLVSKIRQERSRNCYELTSHRC